MKMKITRMTMMIMEMTMMIMGMTMIIMMLTVMSMTVTLCHRLRELPIVSQIFLKSALYTMFMLLRWFKRWSLWVLITPAAAWWEPAVRRLGHQLDRDGSNEPAADEPRANQVPYFTVGKLPKSSRQTETFTKTWEFVIKFGPTYIPRTFSKSYNGDMSCEMCGLDPSSCVRRSLAQFRPPCVWSKSLVCSPGRFCVALVSCTGLHFPFSFS